MVHGIPLFCKRFETEEYADLNGISIEMAARELRYTYFEEIRRENDYDFIATAHHLDDLLRRFPEPVAQNRNPRIDRIKEKSGT